jgi:hypothetical protein
MSNLFRDWFPDEVMDEFQETDTSLYDVIPEELIQHIEDDRNHWQQYDEMPWNQ